MWTIITIMNIHSEWFQEKHLCFPHNWPGSSQLSLYTIDNFLWWAAKFPYRAITIDLTQLGPQPSIARGTREEAREWETEGGALKLGLIWIFLWLLLFWVRSPLIPVPNQRVKRAPGLIHHVAFVNRTTWEVTDDFKTYVLGHFRHEQVSGSTHLVWHHHNHRLIWQFFKICWWRINSFLLCAAPHVFIPSIQKSLPSSILDQLCGHVWAVLYAEM